MLSWFCAPRAVHPYHVVVVYHGHHIEVDATDHEAYHSKVIREAKTLQEIIDEQHEQAEAEEEFKPEGEEEAKQQAEPQAETEAKLN